MTDVRVIAIDWSGAKRPKKKIWRAEFSGETPITPECGLDRDEIVDYLIHTKDVSTTTFVGIDFAFSYPEWFVHKHGCSSAPEFWRVAKEQGEEWLRKCPPPFWGRPGTTRPDCEKLFRHTEQGATSVGGIRPKSVFQIYGPGHVGTGSLRGMPALLKLSEAGFAIWPFDPPGSHTVIEIYPRLLTKEVHKRNQDSRKEYLTAERFKAFDLKWHREALYCEDAFDAAISAVCMREHLGELQSLPAATIHEQVEGKIWTPHSACA